MNTSTRTFLGFSLSLLLAGCAGGPDATEAQVASDGNEGTAASAQSTNMASVVFENVSVTDPVMATAQLAAPSQLWPSGCVTRAKSTTAANTVDVTFTDCTGPFGLLHLDGEETVAFSAAPGGGLLATIDAVNLTVNGSPVSHSATAVITFPTATTRSVVWTGSWQRTDDLGDLLQHTSDLTISVDLTAGCRTATGTAVTTVADRKVDTTITSYQVCHTAAGVEGCPSGAVDHDGVTSGKTVEITFDGSAEAEVTGPKGDTFEVPLVCTPIGS